MAAVLIGPTTKTTTTMLLTFYNLRTHFYINDYAAFLSLIYHIILNVWRISLQVVNING